MKTRIHQINKFYLLFRLLSILFNSRNKIIVTCLSFGYLGILLWFIPNYLVTDYIVWAAILIGVYIINPISNIKPTRKYLWISIFFILFTLFTGVKTFYFLAIGAALLYGIESFIGTIGFLPIFLLALISPTFKYFNNMLGFPIRLKLSELSGMFLQNLGFNAKITGNAIVLNGNEFSVDAACVGLKMMAFSILIGLLFMAFFQRQKNGYYSLFKVVILLLAIIAFNVISNFIRILILTIFVILPENPNHDLVGILCFVLYVVLPSYFAIRWFSKGIKNHNTVGNVADTKNVIYVNSILLVAILILGITRINNPNSLITSKLPITLPGYTKEIVNDDILKFQKKGILLYIKPINKFYGAEHNPMICWVGSGYEFSRIEKQVVGTTEIFTGILKKGNDQIYSAWWFDNGKHQTISQADWRWRALNGENFYLVNINSNSRERLLVETGKLLNNL